MANFNSWSLADVHVNAKGSKTCQLTDGGRPKTYSSGTACTAPFGPSNFDRDPLATRQNLEFRIPPELEAYFDSVDKWMLEYLRANSERIFKKQLTASQVQDAYHPTLKRQGDYPPLLRTKIDSSGRRACRFWGDDKQRREAPVEWRGAEMEVMFHFSHLWIMGTSCGLVVNTTDLLVRETSHAFPWAAEEPPAW
jgi:hypothetical protein